MFVYPFSRSINCVLMDFIILVFFVYVGGKTYFIFFHVKSFVSKVVKEFLFVKE